LASKEQQQAAALTAAVSSLTAAVNSNIKEKKG
jgi:hypothetical protein